MIEIEVFDKIHDLSKIGNFRFESEMLDLD